MQENAKISKLYCQKGYEHQDKEIIMICMQEKCSLKRLCCLSCIDELHVKHELFSVSKFQHFVEQTLSQSKIVKSRDEILELVAKTHQHFRSKIEELKTFTIAELDRCACSVDEYFEKFKDSFNVEKFAKCREDLVKNFSQNKVNYYFDLAEQVRKNSINSKEEAEKIISIASKSMEDKIEIYMKDTSKKITEVIKGLQRFKVGKKSSGWKFSSDYHAACLQISSSGLRAKRGEGSGGYPIAVVSDPLTTTNNQIQFVIVEEPANKGIWMGVCIPDIVKNFNFQSCYGIGKGTYAIDQVGQNHLSAYSWNHHDTNFNSTPKVGWQFQIGDVIKIKVDYEKGIVCFRKGELKYEQPIKLQFGDYYAFVGPTNLGDVLEIVP